VLERYVYDPYGQFTNANGQPNKALTPGWAERGTSAYGWVYLHHDGRYDTTSGLYHFRNRELSPTQGRWMQRDPLELEAGDSNLYRYISNSPPNWQDPTGMAGWDPPKVWEMLGPDYQKKWKVLAERKGKDWWAVVTEAEDDKVLKASRRWFERCPEVDVDVTDKIGIKMLKMEGDVQWKDDKWLVDFKNRMIWIDENDNEDAVAHFKMIIDNLHKDLKAFDIDMPTGMKTLDLMKHQNWAKYFADLPENVLAGFQPSERRFLITLVRLNWNAGVEVISGLSSITPQGGRPGWWGAIKFVLQTIHGSAKQEEIDKLIKK
jgi:RHS repeat-associated protein